MKVYKRDFAYTSQNKFLNSVLNHHYVLFHKSLYVILFIRRIEPFMTNYANYNNWLKKLSKHSGQGGGGMQVL